MLIGFLNTQMRPYRRGLSALVVLQLVQTSASLLLPTLNAAVIDHGILQGDVEYIASVGALMLGVAVIQILTASGAVVLAARCAARLGRDLRRRVFRRVLALSAREVGDLGAPSLLNRTVNDVQQVQNIVLTTADVAVPAVVMCLGGIVLAVFQDVAVSLVIVVLVVVVIAALAVTLGRLGPLYTRMQRSVDRIGHLLRERISGVRVIRAFVRDDHERARFDRTNAELSEAALRVGRIMAGMPVMVTIVMNILTVVIIWISGRRIDDGEMPLGALTALLTYVTLIIVSIIMAVMVFSEGSRAAVSAGRIQQVLDTRTSVPAPRRPVRALAAPGEVELRGATFGYPGAEKPVLRDVDLAVRPGQTVAILGSTGSGKSTLLNLVLRLYDVTAGTVRVHGVDARDIDPALLSRTVGHVPQRPHLFSGTVASNLRFGRPDATDAELWQALEVAQAREFVDRIGLDAPVAQGGANLSGGQRQRLAIARTLVRRPAVYLLDDCFSALDHGTEARLRAALASELSGATVLLVTQRVEAAENADHVLLLDDGRVIGSGTPDRLSRDNPVYREIALSQPVHQEVR
ncbi:ABC transporter ATP-binding protein [Streptomyces pacificus]|uniref:ABC transporter ATP-binding protein n=1 Tax=Streptomyces pacificus TaxID=2705029 RepID=A0A6A0AP70_9ACTN|nr:ABC transporter ATP-binding protein [Streptomyces pacificus]GFH34438.1 ABC transporter ATP-binding protein [Streptomyces pacificus]